MTDERLGQRRCRCRPGARREAAATGRASRAADRRGRPGKTGDRLGHGDRVVGARSVATSASETAQRFGRSQAAAAAAVNPLGESRRRQAAVGQGQPHHVGRQPALARSSCPERDADERPRVRPDRRHWVDERLEEGAVRPLRRPPVDVRSRWARNRPPTRARDSRAGSSPSSGASTARTTRSRRTTTDRGASAPSGRSTRRSRVGDGSTSSPSPPKDGLASRTRNRIRAACPASGPSRGWRCSTAASSSPALERGQQPPTRPRSNRSVRRRRARSARRRPTSPASPVAATRAASRPSGARRRMAATRSSRDAGGRDASRSTSTTGSIQPPVWVGAATPTKDRPLAGRLAHLVGSGGQEGAGAGIDRRVSRVGPRRARPSPRPAGRPRCRPWSRSRVNG